MVKVGPSKTVIGKITAPSVAYFSSRGPSSLSSDILKVQLSCVFESTVVLINWR